MNRALFLSGPPSGDRIRYNGRFRCLFSFDSESGRMFLSASFRIHSASNTAVTLAATVTAPPRMPAPASRLLSPAMSSSAFA